MITLMTGFMLVLSACRHADHQNEKAKDEVYYTCSMHPQIKEEHPGKCPICQMELIAVPKSSMNSTTEVKLSKEQIRLGNIRVDTIFKGRIGDKIILPGTLNFNQEKLSSVSTRTEGRIEKLYVKRTGDLIRKGERIYDLYSEQLNNAKQEYIAALKQEATIGNALINYGAVVAGAKNKLLLWGMSNEQIDRLALDKEASATTAFYSNETGYVTSIGIQEGGYAMEGSTIFQLADLSTLWAEAQVYSSQLSAIDKTSAVVVNIPDLSLEIKGQIDFINPEINPDSRINLVRVTIPNKSNGLHPGMPVYISISNREHHSISIPANAVLSDSRGATVWVQTKPGVYQIRMVETGITNNNAVEILSGLEPGDIVVTSGAYLINSEYIIQNGSDPMAGMDMGGMKM